MNSLLTRKSPPFFMGLTHFFLLLRLCEISERDKKNLVCLKLPWVVSQISTGWKIYLSGFCQLNFNGFLFVQKYGTIGQNIIFVLQIFQLNRKHLVEGKRYFTSVFSNKRSQFVIDLLCILFWGYFVERRGLKKFCWKKKNILEISRYLNILLGEVFFERDWK